MKLNKICLTISSIIMLGLMTAYIFKNADSFKQILNISLIQICIFLMLQFFSISISGFMLVTVLSAFGVKLLFKNGFSLAAMNTFFNYLFVKGGIFAKGYFLKKIYNLSYTEFAVAVGGLTLVSVVAAGSLGAAFLILLYVATSKFNFYLFLLFIFMSGGILGFIKLLHLMITLKGKPQNSFFEKLYKLAYFWKVLANNKNIMYKLFVLTILYFTSYALRLKFGFNILNENISFLECMILSIAGVISSLLALTPGSLGIREFAIGVVHKLIYGDMLKAVVVTTMDRAISIFLIFILGGASYLYIIIKNNKFSIRKNT